MWPNAPSSKDENTAHSNVECGNGGNLGEEGGASSCSSWALGNKLRRALEIADSGRALSNPTQIGKPLNEHRGLIYLSDLT